MMHFNQDFLTYQSLTQRDKSKTQLGDRAINQLRQKDLAINGDKSSKKS